MEINIDEIVNDILSNMDNETKDYLANIEPDMFGGYCQLHFGFGTQIRNKYNLWSYGNADDISAAIINKLVKRIKNDIILDK